MELRKLSHHPRQREDSSLSRNPPSKQDPGLGMRSPQSFKPLIVLVTVLACLVLGSPTPIVVEDLIAPQVAAGSLYPRDLHALSVIEPRIFKRYLGRDTVQSAPTAHEDTNPIPASQAGGEGVKLSTRQKFTNLLPGATGRARKKVETHISRVGGVQQDAESLSPEIRYNNKLVTDLFNKLKELKALDSKNPSVERKESMGRLERSIIGLQGSADSLASSRNELTGENPTRGSKVRGNLMQNAQAAEKKLAGSSLDRDKNTHAPRLNDAIGNANKAIGELGELEVVSPKTLLAGLEGKVASVKG
jgi:hypothetical protein